MFGIDVLGMQSFRVEIFYIEWVYEGMFYVNLLLPGTSPFLRSS